VRRIQNGSTEPYSLLLLIVESPSSILKRLTPMLDNPEKTARLEETITAEKIRRKQFVTLLGTCQDCGQPVTEGQQFFRSDDGIRHALCLFDPAFAKRERELKSKTAQ